MYTGQFYVPWNACLRRCGATDQEYKAKVQKWATCLAVLNSAVIKLSKITQNNTVFRGIREDERRLPSSFYEKGSDGFAGGVNMAFTSTSTEPKVALGYAGGMKCVGSIFQFNFLNASRGADLSWVSQCESFLIKNSVKRCI